VRGRAGKAMSNSIAGLEKGRMCKAGSKLSDLLESVKWNTWHGKVDRALERAEELRGKLTTPFTATARTKVRKLRAEQPITKSFAESAVDQIIYHRFVKKAADEMPWTDQGCQNVLQIRTRVINDELRSAVQRWHPTSQIAA
jgi:hypothetical protein